MMPVSLSKLIAVLSREILVGPRTKFEDVYYISIRWLLAVGLEKRTLTDILFHYH
jgi:hypothetical protein